MGSRFPVTIDDIPFTSTCEHHIMPYHGVVAVGYTPKNGGVIGLSKIPRVIQLLAHRLTIQENLTADIVDVITPVVQSVCVSVTATHSCLSNRGIKTNGVTATTVGHYAAG